MGAAQILGRLCAALLLPLSLLSIAEITAGAAGDAVGPCRPAQAALGVFAGPSPLQLKPLDLLGVQTPTALPLANPVLTAEQLGPVEIARPALVASAQNASHAFLFFAARPCDGGSWGIVAAASGDGGWTWEPLGWAALEEGRSLVGAVVVQQNGTWHMIAEVEQAGVSRPLRLYRASRFPTTWQFLQELHIGPAGLLVPSGISVLQHNEQWWLAGSLPGDVSAGQDSVLAVYKAPSLLGPWALHQASSSLEAPAAATEAGGLFEWEGRLMRLGRACRHGQCGPAEAVQVSVADAKQAAEEPVSQPLVLGPQPWQQRSRWDAAGHSALCIARRADGQFLAVALGSRLPHVPPALPRQLAGAIFILRLLLLACIALLLLSGASRSPLLRSMLVRQAWGRALLARMAQCHAGGSRGRWKEEDGGFGGKQLGDLLPISVASQPGKPEFQNGGLAGEAGSYSSGGPAKSPSALPRSRGGSSQGTYRRGGGSSASSASLLSGQLGSDRSRGRSGWLRRSLPSRSVLAILTALVLTACLLRAARIAARVAAPFAREAVPLPVDGRYSRFTLMVMSYDKRVGELQTYVRHYSRCPSVGEVLVVWNLGEPPVLSSLDSAVPVRIRVEAANSMNNRFRPDPQLRYRAVLSLDDDILMPCTTVEAAFAAWRSAPQRLLGFYPRLLLPEAGQGRQAPPVYQFEEFVFQQGAYNAILAGAAFMDSSFFALYSAPPAAPARALVDEVFNCDDLLLNFIMANWTRGMMETGEEGGGPVVLPPPTELARPERRLDLSRLSGVGISHNQARFKAAADRCLAEFSRLFGGCPLVVQRVPEGYGPPPSCHVLNLDCMYLS